MMNNINIVIPVKDPENAKERLASILSREQRRALALTLIEQTLSFFKAFCPPANVLVVTDSRRVAGRAREEGYAVLLEYEAEGETAAVKKATSWSLENGYSSQLVIPGDMAELSTEDMRLLLSQNRPDPSVILCPATDDDGTNAILATPPNALTWRFGSMSFHDYIKQAETRCIPCSILRLESMVLDLDTPDDIRLFLENGTNTALKQLFEKWNILQNL